jgi:peptide/nickel transport system substrate-binding protein
MRLSPHPHFIARALLALSVFLCALLASAVADAKPAKKIYAGVYLHDVAKFEQKDGVFDADLELWAKWLGDFDPSMLKIANAAEVERELIGEETDGRWHSARWRVRGTLRGEFPVHKFPFDAQTLAVVLELPERYGELVPDLAGSGVREHFSVTGWLYEPVFVPTIAQETYRSDLGAIDGEGKPTAVRRAAFQITLTRPLLTAATKLFLPLLVILLVALVAMFVHPKELEVRSGVGVTALLACFAFHFAVADTMPNVAYITLADVLFLVSYALCALLLSVSIFAFWLNERGRTGAWQKLDIGALIAFPLILGATVFIAFPTASSHADEEHESMGEQTRPKSTRPILRVGINTLPRPSGGLVSRGANWGTTRKEPGGEAYPVLVEEAPAITNDTLRFLADGRLEVAWHLRADLKWSDGQPLTADDLAFALEVSPDARIDEVRVVSPREIVVRFKDRVAVALESITPMPKHALTEAFKKGGYDAVRAYRDKNPLPSAGAYHVTEFKANDKLVLEANPHFCGSPPSIGRIEITRYKSDKALVAAFDKGAIDMILPNVLSPESAQALAERKPESVIIRPSEILLFLHPDLSHPLLAKKDVRTALLMAFDRERLRNEVFGAAASSAPIAHIPVPGALPTGTATVNYDLEAARAALDLLKVTGQRFPLTHGPTPFDKAVVARLVEDAAAVGVTLEPKQVEDTGAVYRTRKHGGLLLITRTGDRSDEPEKYWNIPQVKGQYDRSYRSDAFTDEIVALVEREERALYPERREQIRDRLFTAFSQKLPLLPLVFLADRIVAVPELKGWEVGSGSNFGTTLERWHFGAHGSSTRR